MDSFKHHNKNSCPLNIKSCGPLEKVYLSRKFQLRKKKTIPQFSEKSVYKPLKEIKLMLKIFCPTKLLKFQLGLHGVLGRRVMQRVTEATRQDGEIVKMLSMARYITHRKFTYFI